MPDYHATMQMRNRNVINPMQKKYRIGDTLPIRYALQLGSSIKGPKEYSIRTYTNNK